MSGLSFVIAPPPRYTPHRSSACRSFSTSPVWNRGRSRALSFVQLSSSASQTAKNKGSQRYIYENREFGVTATVTMKNVQTDPTGDSQEEEWISPHDPFSSRVGFDLGEKYTKAWSNTEDLEFVPPFQDYIPYDQLRSILSYILDVKEIDTCTLLQRCEAAELVLLSAIWKMSDASEVLFSPRVNLSAREIHPDAYNDEQLNLNQVISAQAQAQAGAKQSQSTTIESVIYDYSDQLQTGMACFLELVELARFHVVTSTQVDRWQNLKNQSDSYPCVFNSATLNQEDIKQLLEGFPKNNFKNSAYFPSMIVLRRGVGISRRSGLLLSQKLMALQSLLFGWLAAPTDYLVRRVVRLTLPRNVNISQAIMENILGKEEFEPRDNSEVDHQLTDLERKKKRKKWLIRRIAPSKVLKLEWDSLKEFFRPVLSQEPINENLLFVYDSRDPRETLRNFKTLFDRSGGTSKKVQYITKKDLPILEAKLYSNVPWANTMLFLPSKILLPSTFDILRVDIVTLSSAIGGVVAYVRNPQSFYATLGFGLAIVVYVGKVLSGLRNRTIKYENAVKELCLSRLKASNEEVTGSISKMALEAEYSVAILLLFVIMWSSETRLNTSEIIDRAEKFVLETQNFRVHLKHSGERVIHALVEGKVLRMNEDKTISL